MTPRPSLPLLAWDVQLSLLLALFAPALGRADPVTLHIPHVSEPPDLGQLASARATAQDQGPVVITDFRQREPGDGAPCSRKTTAAVSYDDNNLYALFVCQDDPRRARAHLAPREMIDEDDQVLVYLDTFQDGHRAYMFACNPLGVQQDAILAEGQDTDYTFDTLWYSDGKLTDAGYVVRMTIPFRSLRFSHAEVQTWGIALGRIMPRSSEESYWPWITKRVQSFVPQFATATGLRGIAPGQNLQFIPHAVSTRARFLDMSAAVPGLNNQAETRGGLDPKIVLHDAFTLDAALNPDFSQVESDEPQVTINQRYEVVYPERRPFFIENANFFTTPTDLFFSRRIVDPQYGLRLTGKTGPWAVGGLIADDRAPGRLLSPRDALYAKRATDEVVGLQRELGQESSVGVLATSRDFGPSSNRAFSLHTHLTLTPTWSFAAQGMHSYTRPLDGGGQNGTGALAELNRNGRHFDVLARYTHLGPNFGAGLGHIKRVDIRRIEEEVGYVWLPERAVVKFGPSVSGMYNWDHDGRVQDWNVDGEFKVDFTGKTKVKYHHVEAFERFEGLEFRKRSMVAEFSSEWLRWLATSATYQRGTEINYDPAPGLAPFLANAEQATVSLTLRPLPRVRLDHTYIYNRLSARPGSFPGADSTSSHIFENPILRWKLNYQFSRPLSVRAIFDVANVLPNPSFVDLERERRLAGDVLLTYLLNPGTALYLGYADHWENLAIDPATPSILHRTESPELSTGRQFFVKVSYLIRR